MLFEPPQGVELKGVLARLHGLGDYSGRYAAGTYSSWSGSSATTAMLRYQAANADATMTSQGGHAAESDWDHRAYVQHARKLNLRNVSVFQA